MSERKELLSTIWYSTWFLGGILYECVGVYSKRWEIIAVGIAFGMYAIIMRPSFREKS